MYNIASTIFVISYTLLQIDTETIYHYILVSPVFVFLSFGIILLLYTYKLLFFFFKMHVTFGGWAAKGEYVATEKNVKLNLNRVPQHR